MPGRGDKALGEVLRTHRKTRNESQEEVGYKSGLTAGTVSRIELGESRPEWATVRAIAKALDVRLGDLGNEIEAVEGRS
jgi:transcriptional regulator with XRE-family HTH domain